MKYIQAIKHSEINLSKFIVLIIFCLHMTSCVPILSADTLVILRSDEKWETKVEIVFSPHQIMLISSEIDRALDRQIQEMRLEGIDARWQRDDHRDDNNVAYIIQAQGQYLDKLNRSFFDGQNAFQLDESTNPRSIMFSYSPNYSQLGLVQSQTFTLKGGRIISSNGAKSDSHSVSWTNPRGTMEAVIAEAPDFEWQLFVFIALGASVLLSVVITVVLLARRARPPPVSYAYYHPSSNQNLGMSCAYCGAALPGEAQFCPNCGHRL